jgi:hypothetical protein
MSVREASVVQVNIRISISYPVFRLFDCAEPLEAGGGKSPLSDSERVGLARAAERRELLHRIARLRQCLLRTRIVELWRDGVRQLDRNAA